MDRLDDAAGHLEVTLISPGKRHRDIVLRAAPHWTVGQLKTVIAKEHLNGIVDALSEVYKSVIRTQFFCVN